MMTLKTVKFNAYAVAEWFSFQPKWIQFYLNANVNFDFSSKCNILTKINN